MELARDLRNGHPIPLSGARVLTSAVPGVNVDFIQLNVAKRGSAMNGPTTDLPVIPTHRHRVTATLALTALLAFILAASASAERRTWTDNKGRQIIGEFVRLHDGYVVLVRGSRVVTVPLMTLSEEDQDYIRQRLAKEGDVSKKRPSIQKLVRIYDGKAVLRRGSTVQSIPVWSLPKDLRDYLLQEITKARGARAEKQESTTADTTAAASERPPSEDPGEKVIQVRFGTGRVKQPVEYVYEGDRIVVTHDGSTSLRDPDNSKTSILREVSRLFKAAGWKIAQPDTKIVDGELRLGLSEKLRYIRKARSRYHYDGTSTPNHN